MIYIIPAFLGIRDNRCIVYIVAKGPRYINRYYNIFGLIFLFEAKVEQIVCK